MLRQRWRCLPGWKEAGDQVPESQSHRATLISEPPPRRYVQPHLPDSSAYPEPVSRTGDFGVVLMIVPPIPRAIIVHAVVNKCAKNGLHHGAGQGGYQRVLEVQEVIKESGGVKKFRELAEAVSVTGTDAILS